MIRISATQYTLNNKTFEIYVAGCNANPHCDDCHNPELWNFENGNIYEDRLKKELISKIDRFTDIIDSIWLLGGEPLDQNIEELRNLIVDIKSSNKPIWLFTRYELKDVPTSILPLCDYVKCGRHYRDKLSDTNIQYGVTLSTYNQRIYKKGKDY